MNKDPGWRTEVVTGYFSQAREVYRLFLAKATGTLETTAWNLLVYHVLPLSKRLSVPQFDTQSHLRENRSKIFNKRRCLQYYYGVDRRLLSKDSALWLRKTMEAFLTVMRRARVPAAMPNHGIAASVRQIVGGHRTTDVLAKYSPQP